MKRLTTFLVLAAAIGLGAELHAHGGTYKGPGDTVPPGGGGASTPTPPSTPSTPGAPSTPSTPGAPSTPSTPNTPATPPAAPGGAQAPTTGQQADSTDLSAWQFWWEFNKDRFLNLRAKVHGGGTRTDGGGVLTGLGGGANVENTSAPTEQQILTQIIPALYEAVETETDQDILTGVMIALAKIGRDNGRATELFQKHLDAGVQEVAETAAISYGILKDSNSLHETEGVLPALLNDTAAGRKMVGKNSVPVRTRTFAAYGVALIGSYNKETAVKQVASKLLLDALAADKSAQQDIRVACIIGIGLLDVQDPAAASEIVNRLSDYLRAGTDDDIVLAHVPTAMAKLLRALPPEDLTLRDKVLDQVIEMLDGRSKVGNYSRMSAAMALGMLARKNDARSKDIFDALTEAAEKAKDQQVKNFSAISLAYLGSADPVFDSEENKRPVTKFMLAKLKKSNSSYEMWTGLALGVMAFQLNEQHQLGVEHAVQTAVMEKFEEAKSADPLSAYALALGLMNAEQAIPLIREKMDEYRTGDFLGYGSIALGLLRARGESGFLMQIIDDKRRDEELLRQAAIGLGLMGDKTIVAKLMEFMNPKQGRPTLSVLASTATALGFIGDTTSVTPLTETLRNKNLTALGRAFAAVALGMVGDKEMLPWNSRIGADMNYRASVATLVEKSVANGILDIL